MVKLAFYFIYLFYFIFVQKLFLPITWVFLYDSFDITSWLGFWVLLGFLVDMFLCLNIGVPKSMPYLDIWHRTLKPLKFSLLYSPAVKSTEVNKLTAYEREREREKIFKQFTPDKSRPLSNFTVLCWQKKKPG